MAENLMIVESPAKAGTIAKYLGNTYQVLSSFGHIRDLPKKKLGIDVEENFLPTYEISPDKKEVVKKLQDAAKNASLVWLATDEDREGEAISWHLFEVLGVKSENIRRVTFNEITERAVKKAIENWRKIDENLVNAQQARRVLDRLVGFELSPVLWKKVKTGLSAGRVQSVTVRLVVEREREIQQFIPKEYYKISGIFKAKNISFKADLQVAEQESNTAEKVLKILEKLKKTDFFVRHKEVKPATKNPAVPFTTSTLQQEASRKMGFSPAQTMSVAQKLYEKGFITYMRTDSTHLSDQALADAQQEIIGQFGEKYHQKRQYTTQTKGAQEAHEAIRPTQFSVQKIEADNQEKKLYELIWKRTLASQMSAAQFERTKIFLQDKISNYEFLAVGEVLLFEGFMKVYLEDQEEDLEKDAEDAGALPNLKEGETAENLQIQAEQKFSHHPARYTEASLIKKLEELGIGRPSTYAPTLSTIQKRGYVLREDRPGKMQERISFLMEKKENQPVEIQKKVKNQEVGAEKKKLFPTDIGALVNDFLVQHFAQIMNYDFTAQVEKQFDDIASGKNQWQKMIGQFYQPFHKEILQTQEVSERVKKDYLLGKDPASGKNIYAKIARFGPVLQIGENTDEVKPTYIPLEKSQSIQTISLDEALQMIQAPRLPRVLGKSQDKEILIGKGRFGPYIKYGDQFISLKSKEPEDDPMIISLERTLELIKEANDPNKGVMRFLGEDFKMMKGPYGIYIKKEGKNYKIPATHKNEWETVDLPTILTWIEEQDQKNAGKTVEKPKKTVAKKTEKPEAEKKTVKKVKKTEDTEIKVKKTATKKKKED